MTPSETFTAAADYLEALAKEATPGPWRLGRGKRTVASIPRGVTVAAAGAEPQTQANAALIATLDPDTGLLLAKMLRYEAKLATVDPEGYDDPEREEYDYLTLAKHILRKKGATDG